MRQFVGDLTRDQLGFAEAVRSSFQFLLTEFGFSITEEHTTLVRFESEKTVVNVFHGRSSYILGVEIGLRGQVSGRPASDPELRYPLRNIVALADPGGISGYHDIQISSAERLPHFVELLARFTRQFASDALRGDPETFERLAHELRLEGRKNTDASDALWIREKAEKAWQDRNLSLIVDLYSRLDALETVELKNSERGRLQYAKRSLLKDSQADD